MSDIDPRRHLLSSRRYYWNDREESESRPVTFGERAVECRETLASEEGPDGYRHIVVTGGEALISASLLKELAARTRLAVERADLDPDAEQLAVLADDFAERLYKARGLTD